MNEYVIELVRLGFLGVTVVIFLSASSLLSQVVNPKVSPDTTHDGSNLKLRLGAINKFLRFTLLLFVVAVTSELFRKAQENDVLIMVTPPPAHAPEGINDPTIFQGGIPILLDRGTGAVRVRVKNGDTFTFQVYALIEELKRLGNLQKTVPRYQSEHPEGGADDL